MSTGVTTPNLPASSLADSVLVNREGATRQVTLANMAQQIAAINPATVGGKSALAYGAVGDGLANDTSVIDLLNEAGNTVFLSGRTYAYTGDFVPVAQFEGGVIVSSTLGTFDYGVKILSETTTVTVGPAGKLKTLRAARDWTKSLQWVDLTLAVSGEHDLADVRWDHIDTPRLKIIGATMAGAMPAAADMTGVRATDEALIVARFNAVIDVGGSGDNTAGGLTFPNGIGTLENLCFLSNTRYSVGAGFNKSHGSSTPGGLIRLANVAVVGGVWAYNIVGAQVRIRSGTRLFNAYQNTGTQPGGPIFLASCNAMFEGVTEAYNAGQAAKYVLYAQAGTTVFANQSLIATGPYLHGVCAKEGSVVLCDNFRTDGISQPITSMENSLIKGNNWVFENGDIANTNTLGSAPQSGWGNNNSANAVVFAGGGGAVQTNNVTMNNMVAQYAFHAISGTIHNGTTASAIDDCKFTIAFARLYNSVPNYLAYAITNPKAGSLDQVLALALSQGRIGTNSGASFSPAINTTVNGNTLASTG